MTKIQLLENANNHMADAKAHYAEYLELQSEGLVKWYLGMAFITDKGYKELLRLKRKEK